MPNVHTSSCPPVSSRLVSSLSPGILFGSMKSWYFGWVVPLLLLAAASATDEGLCRSTLLSGGASVHFGANVAHSIHSMNVEDLQFFEPNATASNIVPTVDLDLQADTPILMRAPVPDATPFMSVGMRRLDRVLMHMDNKNYDVKFFTILERVAHTMHMGEIYEMSKMEYDKLKQSPPSEEFCVCARDVQSNNVMKALRFAALAMREPALVYGQAGQSYTVGYMVTYSFDPAKTDHVDANGQVDSNGILLTTDDAAVPLVDEAAWDQWKKGLLSMDPSGPKDLALFLYCALH